MSNVVICGRVLLLMVSLRQCCGCWFADGDDNYDDGDA